jgi:hypothetical protein
MNIDLRTLMRGERGVALPLALISLLILTMLVLSVLTLGAVEPQISGNVSANARARQLAEAGIEWAFDCLANQDLNQFLAGPDGVQNTADDQLATSVAGQNIAATVDNTYCPGWPAPGTLPGLGAGTGVFSVTIRNDSIGPGGGYAGDQVLTGVPIDGGGKFADTNGIVIVQSTGTFGGATRQITAVIQRNTLTVNGAATLPGVQADVYMQGTNQSIDGRDWTRTDTAAPTGTGPLRYGIAAQPGVQANIAPTTYQQEVDNGFATSAQQNTIQGKSNSTGSLTTGLSSVGQDSSLTPTTMQSFLNNLLQNPATQIIQSSLACPMKLTGTVGAPNTPVLASTGAQSGCMGNPPLGANINLGTTANPQLTYFRGQLDTSSGFTGLTLSGTIRGAGILVVEDGDMSVQTSGAGLTINGHNVDLYWDGIVIVTGRYVGAGFRCCSTSEIRGAFISQETVWNEPIGYYEFLNQSNMLWVRNSQQNLNMALRAAYNQRIVTWREN